MHSSFGPIRISQTTGSMISHLTRMRHSLVTGTSAPCTSVFKPVWFEGGLPDLGPSPTETYDERTCGGSMRTSTERSCGIMRSGSMRSNRSKLNWKQNL